ncbi:hypothetical protein U1Q18_048703 [Sarracenia purpurea var. burkii]
MRGRVFVLILCSWALLTIVTHPALVRLSGVCKIDFVFCWGGNGRKEGWNTDIVAQKSTCSCSPAACGGSASSTVTGAGFAGFCIAARLK